MPAEAVLTLKKMCRAHLGEEIEGKLHVTDRAIEKFRELIRQFLHPNHEYMDDLGRDESKCFMARIRENEDSRIVLRE